jgi:hypothetical protein
VRCKRFSLNEIAVQLTSKFVSSWTGAWPTVTVGPCSSSKKIPSSIVPRIHNHDSNTHIAHTYPLVIDFEMPSRLDSLGRFCALSKMFLVHPPRARPPSESRRTHDRHVTAILVGCHHGHSTIRTISHSISLSRAPSSQSGPARPGPTKTPARPARLSPPARPGPARPAARPDSDPSQTRSPPHIRAAARIRVGGIVLITSRLRAYHDGDAGEPLRARLV